MGSFDSLEKQYSRIYNDLASKVESAGALSPDGLRQLVLEVQNGLDEAEGLVRGMDLEARTGDPTQRPQLLARLREHKIRLLALKKDFRRKTTDTGGRLGTQSIGSAADEESVAESEGSSASSAGASHRDRLLVSTARVNATSDRLFATRQMASQSEELGVHILKDLHEQRQSLLNAQDVLQGVDDEVGRARHIMRGMVAKMNKNKWTVGLIVFLLFAAIAGVICLKLSH